MLGIVALDMFTKIMVQASIDFWCPWLSTRKPKPARG